MYDTFLQEMESQLHITPLFSFYLTAFDVSAVHAYVCEASNKQPGSH